MPPPESVRISTCRRHCLGSWARASRVASMWSAAVLEPALPGSESNRLEWGTPRMGERVRVLKRTCDCLTPVYELCAAGGQYFIRRIDAHRVDESTRLRCRDAEPAPRDRQSHAKPRQSPDSSRGLRIDDIDEN